MPDAAKIMPDHDRRQSIRFESNLPVELHECSEQSLTASLSGKLLDLSRGGLRVCIWLDAPIGSHFSLSINYSGYDSFCVGQVVWKRESTRGMIYGVRVVNWTLLDEKLAYQLAMLERRSTQDPANLLTLFNSQFPDDSANQS